jgi:receptor protein-tyrosine kinase/non-specific protein-tyrosine kinase
VTEPRQEGLEIRQWGRLIWRRKWLLLAIVIALPVAVYLGSSQLPKTYQSKATINVQATVGASSVFASQISSSSNIAEAATLIQTPVVARRAARILGLPPTAARGLLGHISVAPTDPAEKDSDFLTITAQDSSAVEAARIANAFARAVAQTRTTAAIHNIDKTIATLRAQGASDQATREALAVQLQQLRGLKASQGGTTPIVEAAVPAASPISPRPGRNTAIALVLALLIAAALAPLLDRLDRRLREPAELEDLLEAPVLAMIPDDAFPGHPPSPHVRESFQTLRASLTYFNVDRSLRNLVVASPIQQDGKTTVAINLALAYAMDERDVVLIDGDMRRPQVATRLGKEASVGLDSVLVGEKTLDEAFIYVDTGAGRLRLLPGAEPPPNPAVLLGSQRMRALIAELTEQVDMVVIDTPGLLAVSDAIPLFSQVAGSIVVARLNRTPIDAIRRARQVIASSGGTVLGGVATGAHAGGLYGYYGYYGYYGGGEENGSGKNGSKLLRGRLPNSS